VSNALSNFPNLTRLTLPIPIAKQHPGFSALASLNNLTYLDISGHPLEAKKRFIEIAKVTTLETLIMKTCKLKDNNFLIELKKLKNLKNIDVSNINDPSDIIGSLKKQIDEGRDKKLIIIRQ